MGGKKMAATFTHLHVHTEYSLLDGSGKIKEMVARAKELNMDSLAITDHGVMYGAIDFYKAAKEAGIKPIIGCEVYVAPGSRFDKEANAGDDRYYHLVLLAENNNGYENLMKIVSKGFVDGFYYKPRVDYEVLKEYHENVIALSACLAGEVQRYLNRGMYEEGMKAAYRYQEIFGEGNFFLELQDHGMPEQKNVNQQLIRMSRETGIELVATNDVHYINREDEEAHDVLLCIQTGKRVADENRMRYEGGQYYLKSEEEMAALFPYAKEALENTAKIAARCEVDFVFHETKLPKFDVPEGYTAWEYLNKLCTDGLNAKYPSDDGKLRKQLDYELSIIQQMGYVDYFLIVWDFIKYAKDNGISVGPGRGSAAGSLVSYCLEITTIDPVRYSLIFERFLNPERVSMPDIDVDFCFERRQEVIDYVVRKYGKEKVVQIVTFGTMAARGVIRDVGRALDLPYARVDAIAKMVPSELNITIDKALETNSELKTLYEMDSEVHNLIDMSRKLEGLPRHTSMHAAGVVICDKAASEYVPLSKASDGQITTQYTMTTLEELGLLKMDFLGLRTLTVIQNAVRLIAGSRNINIDIDNIDYNDKAVFDSISTGRTDGVFQIESSGMKSFMKELKPQSLEDIIAGIALYRPGPMDFIPQYLRGKNNQDTIKYHCPQLEPILEPTYGCIVYQEQVMQIVRDLAGYTLGQSDLLRRAMSKKKDKEMQKERANFVYGNEEKNIKGCINNGISEEIANKIYDEMTDFAKYAFNKSHAAAYAVVSYQTTYLKHYYPVEFMAALMTSVIANGSKVSEYIYSCRSMNINILQPDINEGEAEFSVSGNNIRYGLNAIKGIGRAVLDAIIEEREANGLYRNLSDFVERNLNNDLKKNVVENLIKAGAFDSFGVTRKQLMSVYLQVIDDITTRKKKSISGQMSLFDFAAPEEKEEYEIKLPNVGEFDKDMLLTYEKEVLGVYISGHPLEDYEEKMRKNITARTSDFIHDEETNETIVEDGKTVWIGGMITAKSVKTTKSNKMMAFITVEDLFGSVEVILFPRDYEANSRHINVDDKVFIRGKVQVSEEEAGRLICERIVPFDSIPSELWIKFDSKEEYLAKEEVLLSMLADSDGNDSIVIYCAKEKARKNMPQNYNICINGDIIERLSTVFGKDNVKVVEKSIENIGKMH
ncbi:MAG: DNA polymerase III subunit alpha [Lachnospiraceae bacterium]|nr:DNA polymerase III subunit alpha [Lachnospiraceae bacterium]